MRVNGSIVARVSSPRIRHPPQQSRTESPTRGFPQGPADGSSQTAQRSGARAIQPLPALRRASRRTLCSASHPAPPVSSSQARHQARTGRPRSWFQIGLHTVYRHKLLLSRPTPACYSRRGPNARGRNHNTRTEPSVGTSARPPPMAATSSNPPRPTAAHQRTRRTNPQACTQEPASCVHGHS